MAENVVDRARWTSADTLCGWSVEEREGRDRVPHEGEAPLAQGGLLPRQVEATLIRPNTGFWKQLIDYELKLFNTTCV